jgi:hypothetical protein
MRNGHRFQGDDEERRERTDVLARSPVPHAKTYEPMEDR